MEFQLEKKDNYMKLLQEVKKNLERWRDLPVSLMGRIPAIKMNILPHIVLLFHTISIHIIQSFLVN